MTDSSGIYCVYFEEVDSKYYIGCSITVNKRIQEHKNLLKNNKHCNYLLQSNYNLGYTPIFEILEICASDDLFDKEIEYIQRFDSYKNGFNLTMGGEGCGYGEFNSNSKYTEIDYYNVLKELAYTSEPYSKISEKTGVSLNTIKHIASLKTHAYLKEKYPLEYEAIEKKLYTRTNAAGARGIQYPPVISPIGEVYTVYNIHEFAREHSLQYQNLHKVLTGQRKSHLGWKLLC